MSCHLHLHFTGTLHSALSCTWLALMSETVPRTMDECGVPAAGLCRMPAQLASSGGVSCPPACRHTDYPSSAEMRCSVGIRRGSEDSPGFDGAKRRWPCFSGEMRGTKPARTMAGLVAAGAVNSSVGGMRPRASGLLVARPFTATNSNTKRRPAVRATVCTEVGSGVSLSRRLTDPAE
jgi:hypothetical protein